MSHRRIVIKIGSSSLTAAGGGLDRSKIQYYADELALLQQQGYQPLVVTSGAVAAGYARVGYRNRPRALREKQAAAAVGQALLMQAYQEALQSHGLTAAQILLTRSDFANRQCVHNALMTVEELLYHKIIPVINENDSISVDELKYGDNDTLSALVANLVKAERLLIITDTDGLYTGDPRKDPQAQKIGRVTVFQEDIFRYAKGAGSAVGTGGMRSKLEAARMAILGGIPVFVGKAEEPGDLLDAVRDRGKGTYFDTTLHTLPVKKQWVGFHSQPKGSVTVDNGAVEALTVRGKSLLPAGIIKAEGDFHPGDVIEVKDPDGNVIGRGITNYAPWQITAVAGLSTREAQNRIEVPRIEVIHRDEWVAIRQPAKELNKNE